ncbi:hypothetical protein OG581_14295 [Streptomyces sp. NBC_01386]|uniref:hypothetical protein n=1 Tax=Streptomyces sp. NBC_01386 TaxID=2903848 RepID=UPI003253F8B5
MAERHLVTAELLAGARSDGGSSGTSAGARAPVRWSDQAGVHAATVQVAAGQQEGTRAQLWLDDHGNTTSPPTPAESVTAAGAAAGASAVLSASAIVGARTKGSAGRSTDAGSSSGNGNGSWSNPRWNLREQ